LGKLELEGYGYTGIFGNLKKKKKFRTKVLYQNRLFDFLPLLGKWVYTQLITGGYM
jgi:hypothetical protein